MPWGATRVQARLRVRWGSTGSVFCVGCEACTSRARACAAAWRCPLSPAAVESLRVTVHNGADNNVMLDRRPVHGRNAHAWPPRLRKTQPPPTCGVSQYPPPTRRLSAQHVLAFCLRGRRVFVKATLTHESTTLHASQRNVGQWLGCQAGRSSHTLNKHASGRQLKRGPQQHARPLKWPGGTPERVAQMGCEKGTVRMWQTQWMWITRLLGRRPPQHCSPDVFGILISGSTYRGLHCMTPFAPCRVSQKSCELRSLRFGGLLHR